MILPEIVNPTTPPKLCKKLKNCVEQKDTLESICYILPSCSGSNSHVLPFYCSLNCDQRRLQRLPNPDTRKNRDPNLLAQTGCFVERSKDPKRNGPHCPA